MLPKRIVNGKMNIVKHVLVAWNIHGCHMSSVPVPALPNPALLLWPAPPEPPPLEPPPLAALFL